MSEQMTEIHEQCVCAAKIVFFEKMSTDDSDECSVNVIGSVCVCVCVCV